MRNGDVGNNDSKLGCIWKARSVNHRQLEEFRMGSPGSIIKFITRSRAKWKPRFLYTCTKLKNSPSIEDIFIFIPCAGDTFTTDYLPAEKKGKSGLCWRESFLGERWQSLTVFCVKVTQWPAYEYWRPRWRFICICTWARAIIISSIGVKVGRSSGISPGSMLFSALYRKGSSSRRFVFPSCIRQALQTCVVLSFI